MWEIFLQRVYILMAPMCVIYDFWLLLLHIVNCGCLILALILEGKYSLKVMRSARDIRHSETQIAAIVL